MTGVQLAFVGDGVTQTPINERLVHLKRLHEEWTAKLQTVSGADADLARAFAQALADLEVLIRELERRQDR